MVVGWRWYLGGCAIGAVVYNLIPSDPVQAVIATVLHLSGAVAIVAGVRRHRPAPRWPWYALAVNVALFATADVAYWLQTVLLRRDVFPSIADALYVPSSIMLIVALIGFARARRTGLDIPGLLDALILSTGGAMLAWLYVIAPTARLGDLTLLGRAVSLAYPILALLGLTVLLRVAIGSGRRPAAYRMLLIGVITLLATDTTYTLLELHDAYAAGGVLDIGWMVTHVLFGAAALHPAMATVSQPTPPPAEGMISRCRLIAMATAGLMAPLVLTIEWLQDDPLDVPVVVAGSVLLFLLVMARLHGVVGLLAASLAVARGQAHTDQLTGLANRRQFHARWEQTLAGGTGPTALLYVDLDGFKAVNDTLGHETGDAVLEAVAGRISQAVRVSDLVARLGGDEFAVILPGATDEQAAGIAARIVEAVAEPIPVGGVPVRVGASIGVITAPAGADPEGEIKRADTAMYAAKAAGRGRVHIT
ncbi:diguanylate cyclase domain-containing protein [Actinoplanes sp. G11-F43]|uniref:diguanylate cyclase domain-containing protein n=1 Tax=Actinoplanes sp. G11-F43 TaxID=3424130 RepID=UPI003D33F0B2